MSSAAKTGGGEGGVQQTPTDRRDDATRELGTALDALERLVGGVAHDLCNLTTVIRTSVETLRTLELDSETGKGAGTETGTDDPLREAQLARIDGAAAEASALMAALASFGRREVEIRSLELEPLVRRTSQLLHRALGIEVVFEAGARNDAGTARPDGDRHAFANTRARDDARVRHDTRRRDAARVRADLARLVRALMQLCAAAARGNGRVRLFASGDREIAIEIRPGDGGTAAVAPSERDVEHAKALLGEIEGTLALAFADGRGAWSGSLRLSSAPPAADVTPRSRGGLPARRRGRALVAEDHAQVREALIEALSRSGFAVDAVGDGDALIDRALAEAGRFDVLLIDFDLPGRDGGKALRALREAGIETPALIISGNVDFPPRVAGLANTDFLQKPFGLADVRAWATRHVPRDPGPGAQS